MPRALTSAQTLMAGAMSEADLEQNVMDLCKAMGIARYHTYRSKRSPEGWPDDVMVGNGHALFRELKRHGKRPTVAQQQWLDGLAAAGLDVGVWRPEDWFSGRIREELKPLSGRR